MLATGLMIVAGIVQLFWGPAVTYWSCTRVREVGAPVEPVTSLLVSRWVAGVAGVSAVALIAGLLVAAALLTQRWEVVSTGLVLLSSSPLDDAPTHAPWQGTLLLVGTAALLVVGLVVQGFVAGKLVLRWGYPHRRHGRGYEGLVQRTVFRAEYWAAGTMVLAPAIGFLLYVLASRIL